MKTLNILFVLSIIAHVFVFTACETEEMPLKPKADFAVFKGSSAFKGHKSDTIQLLDVPSLTFRVNDTIIFVNKSTGMQSSIFTGDTTFNANGTVSGGHMSDQPLSRFYDSKTGQTYNITAGYFPRPGVDLAIEYGNESKRKYKNEAGEYLTGIYPYKYARIGKFKVKVYTYNWNKGGEAAIDSAVVYVNIIP